MSALAVGYVFQALLKPSGRRQRSTGASRARRSTMRWLGDTHLDDRGASRSSTRWKWMGLSMLIYLAGLKTIPEDVLEAARIDGASRWQTFWQIRFPLLAPAVTFNVATALLGSMNGFDIVQATTGGGPAPDHRDPQHLHLPHLRPGPVRPGHHDEPGAVPVVALMAFPVISCCVEAGAGPVSTSRYSASDAPSARRLQPVVTLCPRWPS